MDILLNTLYTPLDCPEVPTNFNLDEIKEWLVESYDKSSGHRAYLRRLGRMGEIKPRYPWDLTTVYDRHRNGWQNNFDEKFPSLATYFPEAFNLSLNEITSIIALPIRENHKGMGYYHQDGDEYGLRVYIDFNDAEGKLFLRKTIEPYNEQPPFGLRHTGSTENILEKNLVDEVIECKRASDKQCFFINNVRAGHTTYVSDQHKSRIAVIVYHNKTPEVLSKIADLVQRSVEKYKDYAIKY